MKKPKILLSGGKNIDNYIDAITQLGGIPVGGYLPQTDDSCDGLVLCGGADIEPSYYGEENTASKGIDLARDRVEFALLEAFIDAGKPVFGVCRGCQLINVYFGGSLYQDIATAADHCSFQKHDLVHTVSATKGSVLQALYGDRFPVNSYHHQAVKTVGDGLEVTAKSDTDGVVEAFSHTSLPVFAVQWHPERLCFKKSREDAVDGAKLIAHFLELCSK